MKTISLVNLKIILSEKTIKLRILYNSQHPDDIMYFNVRGTSKSRMVIPRDVYLW